MKNISKYILPLSLACLVAACGSAQQSDLSAFLDEKGFERVQLTKLASGHEAIEATINGVPGLFILDSGAGATVLHSDNTEKFGIEAAGKESTATGAGGQKAMRDANINSFAFEGLTLDLETISVMDLGGVVSALETANGVTVDGVVGQGILTDFSGIIDVKGQSLYLLPHTSTE